MIITANTARAISTVILIATLSTNAAAFTEESLPAADLSATATPTLAPASSAIVTPTPAATPTATPTAAALPAPLLRPQPSPTASASSMFEPLGEASPQPTDVPPALDVGAITPSVAISDSSLAPLIAAAPPARGAALRLTENAREQIAAGNSDEAVRTLTRALSIDPSNAYAYFYLGRAYYLRKDYKQAVGFLQHAEIGFGANPAWLAETLAFEGICYEEFGQTADALATYQRAIDASPGNLMARAGLGRLSASASQAGSATDTGAPPPPESNPAPPPPEEPPPQGPPLD